MKGAETKTISVHEYFTDVKKMNISANEKLIEVVQNGREMYFPISLCRKPLPLEYGIKNQSIRMNEFKKNIKILFGYLQKCNLDHTQVTDYYKQVQ